MIKRPHTIELPNGTAVTLPATAAKAATAIEILNPEATTQFKQQTAQIFNRFDQSKTNAANIPNWATWTQAEWTAFFDTNLSDAQAELVTNITTAKVMIKRQNEVINAMAKMLMALRDETWPDLPE